LEALQGMFVRCDITTFTYIIVLYVMRLIVLGSQSTGGLNVL
jgi:hypothetical protein